MSYQFGDTVERAPEAHTIKQGVPFQDLFTKNCEKLAQGMPAIGNLKFTPILANQTTGWRESLQARNLIALGADFGKSGRPLVMKIERYVCPWSAYKGVYFQITWAYQESWGIPQASTSGTIDMILWSREQAGSESFTATAVQIPFNDPPYTEWQERTGALGASVTLRRVPDSEDCPDSPISCTFELSGGPYDYVYGTPVVSTATYDCVLWTMNGYNFTKYWTVANFAGDPIGVVKTLNLAVISYVLWEGPPDVGWVGDPHP